MTDSFSFLPHSPSLSLSIHARLWWCVKGRERKPRFISLRHPSSSPSILFFFLFFFLSLSSFPPCDDLNYLSSQYLRRSKIHYPIMVTSFVILFSPPCTSNQLQLSLSLSLSLSFILLFLRVSSFIVINCVKFRSRSYKRSFPGS